MAPWVVIYVFVYIDGFYNAASWQFMSVDALVVHGRGSVGGYRYTDMYIHLHNMYVCMHIDIYVHTYICLYEHTYIYIHEYIKYLYIFTYMGA